MGNGIIGIILFVSIVSTFIPITNNAMAQLAGTSSTLYGTTAFGGAAGFAAGSLYTITPTSGAATLVGLLAEPWGGGVGGGCGAIDFHPMTGVLYGICFDSVVGDAKLVTISTSTGAITSVIGTGLGTMRTIMDMSFHPTSGILYAVGFEPTGTTIELWIVSLAAGTAASPSGAEIGPGFAALFAAGNAMAFNSAGTLFISNAGLTANDLYTISLTTEVATLVGTALPYIGYPAPATFHRNNAGDFDPALAVFAVTTNSAGGGAIVPNHLGANAVAGSGWTAPAGTSFIGTTAAKMDGLAFQPATMMLIGGEGIPIDTTSLLIAGVQTSTIWMIPVFLSIGIAGLVVLIKKKIT